MLSPIILFAYNRPFHTYHTLIALTKNKESKDSDLIVYIDGPRNIKELNLIDNVEKIISSFQGKFNSIKINRAEINKGLAKNIIDGISNELNNYESVIILEDDIIVSTKFLEYTNNALNFYQNINSVWHINAFNLPIEKNINTEYVFTRLMFCWGWATWKDRWFSFVNDYLSQDPYHISFIFDKSMRNELDLGLKSNLFWKQIEQNKKDKKTWAIFWYCHIFKNKGLCLTPLNSFTKNIGLDGSGVNCGETTIIDQVILNEKYISKFPSKIIEDHKTIEKIKSFYKKSEINLIKKLIKKFFPKQVFYKIIKNNLRFIQKKV